jgi:DNA uptake protein ComE-like DNA-binding protein
MKPTSANALFTPSTLLLASLCALGLAAPQAKLDINHASVQQLEVLPGVGPRFAAQIYRARPFKNASDFEHRLPRVPTTLLKHLEGLVSFH